MLTELQREQDRRYLNAGSSDSPQRVAGVELRAQNVTLFTGNQTTTCATSSSNQHSGDSLNHKTSIDSDRLLGAYQGFVEAEQATDALMPTLSNPLPVLTELDIQKFF